VKVRGTAQTVADKYMQLARDAHSSGDTVMAESYYQHAEHYLRILAAAQAYNQQHMGAQQYRRPLGEETAENPGEDFQGGGMSHPEADVQPSASEASGQQPDIQGYESDARQMRRPHEDRPRRHFDRGRPPNEEQAEQRTSQGNGGETGRQWEAPSFLRRSAQPGGEIRERRPRYERPRDGQGNGPSAESEPVASESPVEPAQPE
jgi:hypothetical protein